MNQDNYNVSMFYPWKVYGELDAFLQELEGLTSPIDYKVTVLNPAKDTRRFVLGKSQTGDLTLRTNVDLERGITMNIEVCDNNLAAAVEKAVAKLPRDRIEFQRE